MNILYLDSDTMGIGNDELGSQLAISFLKQIVHQNMELDAVFCVNKGAFLTTKNKQAIDLLRQMEEKGTIVSTCGTCLTFFDIQDQVKVGEVGSMEWFVLLLKQADKVIRM